jgi:hypothetical protein
MYARFKDHSYAAIRVSDGPNSGLGTPYDQLTKRMDLCRDESRCVRVQASELLEALDREGLLQVAPTCV